MTGRQITILDVTYDAAAPVGQYVACVAGADGFAALPAGQNAPGFLGVSVVQGSGPAGTSPSRVSLRKLGIVLVVSNGAVNFGDHLIIASAAGDVMSVEAQIQAGTNGLLNVIGTAESSAAGPGQLIGMCISPQVVPA